MKQELRYICEGCESEYKTEEEAQACENKWLELTEKVKHILPGDIVRLGWQNDKGIHYTWSTGWIEDSDPDWLAEVRTPEEAGESKYSGNMRFYYYYFVVTAVEIIKTHYSKHEIRVHIYSAANKGYNQGWTRFGHINFINVQNPPEAVVTKSKEHIGKKFKDLL